MAVEIRVPPLGESLVDAVVGTWLKQEGDAVNRGESLVELETDKVNLDVTAEEDGVLARIERREGEVVTVGEVLGLVSSSNGASAPAPDTATARRNHGVCGMSLDLHHAKANQAASPRRALPRPTIVSYDRWVTLTGGRSCGGVLSRPSTKPLGSWVTSSESIHGTWME